MLAVSWFYQNSIANLEASYSTGSLSHCSGTQKPPVDLMELSGGLQVCLQPFLHLEAPGPFLTLQPEAAGQVDLTMQPPGQAALPLLL